MGDNKRLKQLKISKRLCLRTPLEGCFCIISPDTNNKLDDYSRKKIYSINTQTIADGKLLILDVVTGFSVSMHDARVVRHSAIYNKANDGEILNFPTKVIEGLSVRPLILGDGV